MQLESTEMRDGFMGNRELAAIFALCGAAVVAEWILSFWQLAPPALLTWSTLLRGGVNIFWICGLVATNLVAYISAACRRERWVIGLLGLAIFAAAFAAAAAERNTFNRILESAKWFGLFGICALAYQIWQPGGIKRFLIVVCFSLFVPISAAYLAMTYVIRPETLDIYAYAFDLSLGGGVASYFFILFHRSGVVSTIALMAYVSLLGAYLVLFGLQSRFADRSVVPALRIFLITAVLGFVCYFIFPVVGPRNFFGNNYPGNLPGFSDFKLGLVPAIPTARNGMPSLHFAWALLLVLNVPRTLPYAKAAFALFCFLTMLGTLGTGEHYFVDLVAALPFAMTIQALGQWINGKKRREYAKSAVRSGIIFIAFLILVVLSPEWLHVPWTSWSVTTVLIAHFAFETRRQQIDSTETSLAQV